MWSKINENLPVMGWNVFPQNDMLKSVKIFKEYNLTDLSKFYFFASWSRQSPLSRVQRTTRQGTGLWAFIIKEGNQGIREEYLA